MVEVLIGTFQRPAALAVTLARPCAHNFRDFRVIMPDQTDESRDTGGFQFWREMPPNHCGGDVLARLHVMARYGGCRVIPSCVYHQEVPTTVDDRSVDAPRVLGLQPGLPHGAR